MHRVINGIDLHWESVGEGEPLLWLHGAMGCGDDWRFVFDQPPDGYRLIAPDLRGHGASTGPSGSFTFRQCAQDVLDLLAHLRLDRVKAIGVSGGGITLLHMATLRPAAIGSVVIVSAPPYFPAQARAIMRQVSAAALDDAAMTRMRASHRGGGAHDSEGLRHDP